MAFHVRSSQSFEPRVGTAQFVFGVIYVLITLIALSLAFYVRSEGQDGYLQMFMAVLFAIMAVKSFFIASRIKSLLNNGTYIEAEVDSCEPVRGITVIKGVIDVPEFGLIHIESRLVGEAPAHEINRYMKEHNQNKLPALIVGVKSNRPRGMFTVKCKNGHLVEESLILQEQKEAAAQKAKELEQEFDALQAAQDAKAATAATAASASAADAATDASAANDTAKAEEAEAEAQATACQGEQGQSNAQEQSQANK